jgi:hypothetical protein
MDIQLGNKALRRRYEIRQGKLQKFVVELPERELARSLQGEIGFAIHDQRSDRAAARAGE